MDRRLIFQAYIAQNWHHVVVLALLASLQIYQLIEPKQTLLALRFDRGLPQEYWRYLSCHLVHLSVNHFLMNLLGYSLLIACFLKESKPCRDLTVFVVIMIGTSVGLYFFDNIARYVGLSGVLHGLWVYMLITTMQRTPKLNLLFVLLLAVKVVSEQVGFYSQAETAEFIGGPVATFSHLCGFLSGLVCGLLTISLSLYSKQRHS